MSQACFARVESGGDSVRAAAIDLVLGDLNHGVDLSDRMLVDQLHGAITTMLHALTDRSMEEARRAVRSAVQQLVGRRFQQTVDRLARDVQPV